MTIANAPSLVSFSVKNEKSVRFACHIGWIRPRVVHEKVQVDRLGYGGGEREIVFRRAFHKDVPFCCIIFGGIVEHQETDCVRFIKVWHMIQILKVTHIDVHWHEENAIVCVNFVTNSVFFSLADAVPFGVTVFPRPSVGLGSPRIAHFEQLSATNLNSSKQGVSVICDDSVRSRSTVATWSVF